MIGIIIATVMAHYTEQQQAYRQGIKDAIAGRESAAALYKAMERFDLEHAYKSGYFSVISKRPR